MQSRLRVHSTVLLASLLAIVSIPLAAQTVTYSPYIQPGDNGPFGSKDQMVVTWQTDEPVPGAAAYSVQFGTSLASLSPAVVSGRVVDNYLAADSQFTALVLPNKYGAHSN